MKPGITDWASIKFRNENDLLAAASDPEKYYIEQIMPEKLRINLAYIRESGMNQDFRILIQTLLKVFIKNEKN